MKLHFFRGRPAAALKTLNQTRLAGRVAYGFCSVAREPVAANTIVAGLGSWALWRNCGPCSAWRAIQGPAASDPGPAASDPGPAANGLPIPEQVP